MLNSRLFNTEIYAWGLIRDLQGLWRQLPAVS